MRRHELTRLERPVKISVANQQWHEAIHTDLELRVNPAGQVSSRCHGLFQTIPEGGGRQTQCLQSGSALPEIVPS